MTARSVVSRRVRHGDAKSVEHRVRFSVKADRIEGRSASKVRFFVTSLVQDALFREGAGTECVFPQSALFLTCANVEPSHGKAHSRCAASRKSAFWKVGVTEKRILDPTGWAECTFP